MEQTAKKVAYPENLPLRKEVQESGVSISQFAKRIGVTREVLSLTVNGHYKGVRIVKELKTELKKEALKQAEQTQGE